MSQAMLFTCVALAAVSGNCTFAQGLPDDHDKSPHTVRFVVVEGNVNLEVLDWGGSDRPMILLPGGNRTAHDFDNFAQKLTGEYHVYGITRRGSGASSAPAATDANYSADRLGDDVLAVIDDLRLVRPILLGHSLGGQELSSIGSRHAEKVSGLIYLDAGYQYAYYDRSKGFLDIEINEVRRKLEQLELGKRPADPRHLLDELLRTNLPELERTLRQIDERFKNAPPQPQAAAPQRPSIPPIIAAMNRGSQRYTDIKAPVLAIFAFEPLQGRDGSPDRIAAEARNQMKRDQAAAFQAGVLSARIVRLENAGHDVFRSNEADVVREIEVFTRNLPKLDGKPVP